MLGKMLFIYSASLHINEITWCVPKHHMFILPITIAAITFRHQNIFKRCWDLIAYSTGSNIRASLDKLTGSGEGALKQTCLP